MFLLVLDRKGKREANSIMRANTSTDTSATTKQTQAQTHTQTQAQTQNVNTTSTWQTQHLLQTQRTHVAAFVQRKANIWLGSPDTEDLSIGMGCRGVVCVLKKLLYFGLALSEAHKAAVFQWIERRIFDYMKQEGSPVYQPALAELGWSGRASPVSAVTAMAGATAGRCPG